MKKLNKEQRGFSITLEVMLASLLMVMMLNVCVYVMKLQTYQKTMYNAFVTTCVQVSRWGGTTSNMASANGRNASIIDAVTNELIREGVNSSTFRITANPQKVTSSDEDITVKITWQDPSFGLIRGSTKTMEMKTKTFIREGKLL